VDTLRIQIPASMPAGDYALGMPNGDTLSTDPDCGALTGGFFETTAFLPPTIRAN